MNLTTLLTDIHALEEDILAFERRYGIRSDVWFAAYSAGEEPEDDRDVLDFQEWASVYKTWLQRQVEYRTELHRQQQGMSVYAFIRKAV
jgi:hypothetical protein